MEIVFHIKLRIRHLIRTKNGRLPHRYKSQNTGQVWMNKLLGVPWQGEVPVQPGPKPMSYLGLAQFRNRKYRWILHPKTWAPVLTLPLSCPYVFLPLLWATMSCFVQWESVVFFTALWKCCGNYYVFDNGSLMLLWLKRTQVNCTAISTYNSPGSHRISSVSNSQPDGQSAEDWVSGTAGLKTVNGFHYFVEFYNYTY